MQSRVGRVLYTVIRKGSILPLLHQGLGRRFLEGVHKNKSISLPRFDFRNYSRCQRTYIEVLREIQPEEEENEAKLSPDQIMEFFEACDTLLALPGTLN